MATKKRIYVVTRLVRDGSAPGTKPEHRLINATSAAQAVRHAASTILQHEVATPHKVAELVGAGIKVEEAGGDEA